MNSLLSIVICLCLTAITIVIICKHYDSKNNNAKIIKDYEEEFRNMRNCVYNANETFNRIHKTLVQHISKFTA